MKHREVVTCPGHPVGWLGPGSPPMDPSRVQDEIRSVSFIHLFLASLLPFLVPLYSSGWCSHFLKVLGPQAPRWLLVLLRSAEKEQEMEAGSPGCRCEGCKARPREGSAWRLPISDSPALWSSVCPSPQDRAERGAKHQGPRAQLPLGLGNITAFQCRSHFKLISLCIMFFKSFLNKTKIQSVSLPLEVGKRIRF